MYFTTEHSIGETVYFCNEAGSTVTRAEVAEIRVTQYHHSQHIAYLLTYGNDGHEVVRGESALFRRADSAFSAWDRDHPQLAEPEAVDA